MKPKGYDKLRDALSRFKPNLSFGRQIFLLTTAPLILCSGLIAIVVTVQSARMADREIAALEKALIETKKEELKNYLSIARTAFNSTYGRAAPDDYVAQQKVMQVLSAMIYGQDGYFFVYDYDGNALVSPRDTARIGRNWTGLSDINGIPVTDHLIDLARSGGGYHEYHWRKPSTGEIAPMVAYVIGLQDWRWAIGTGVFMTDVLEPVAVARAQTHARIQATFLQIGGITLGALLVIFSTGLLINIRERKLSDGRLKALTQRVFDTQEEERARVARELHDGISQMLVGIRYKLELSRHLITRKDAPAKAEASVVESIEALQGAIGEVRRISHDLRPGVLDDLGLGPALQELCKSFEKRTGMSVDFDTVVFRNRLDREAKNALYRIAQEALTNVERHSGATHVSMRLFGHRRGATLRIADNGRKADAALKKGGLGLRNMQERVEQLSGSFSVVFGRHGTVIEALVPLEHFLAAKDKGPQSWIKAFTQEEP